MSEKITYKDSKGNAYEQVDCEGCDACALNDADMGCLNAPCEPGKGWKLVGEKVPDVVETLRSAIVACQRVRGHICSCEHVTCPFWTAKNCPLRKHLAALGDENAWIAK